MKTRIIGIGIDQVPNQDIHTPDLCFLNINSISCVEAKEKPVIEMCKSPGFVSDGFLFRVFQFHQSMYVYLYVYVGFWDISPSGTGIRMSM